MFVQPNNAADDTAITLKMTLPVSVAEHDVRGAVWAMLIRAMKKSAKIRLNSQYIEVISCGFQDPGRGRIVARVEPYRSDVISCQAVKAAIAITKVEIVGIGMVDNLIGTALDCPKTLSLRHI